MNAHVFRRICDALAPMLPGARLEKIHALSREVSQWSFHGRNGRFTLMLRAHRQKPFFFVPLRRIAVGAPPPAVIMRLRKYLSGQRVTGVFRHWTARQLWLRFHPGTDVWLCLDLREGPSLSWEAPEALDPVSLLDGLGQDEAIRWPSPEDLAKAGPEAWKDWPVLSPALRRTLALLPREEQAALLIDLETGGGDVFVYEGAGGALDLSAWPLPEALRNGREERVFEDPLEAARLVGEVEVIRGLADDAARRAARPHTAEITRLEKLLAKLEKEETRLASMAEAQADALALQAGLYLFSPEARQEHVALETQEGSRSIVLDPRLTVRENMEALFHRARRGRRGLSLMASRRESVFAELEAAKSRAAMASGMAPSHMLGKKPERQPRAAAPSVSVPQLPRGVQAFRSSDGLLLLRGRDAKGNLAALKMGRPDDMWLHAEGSAGAHVIIRRPAGHPIPDQTLREAAILAALKSPYKDAGTAMVQCALVRHVHPMRGASPGTVRIDRHEPGLAVRIDPELEAALSL